MWFLGRRRRKSRPGVLKQFIDQQGHHDTNAGVDQRSGIDRNGREKASQARWAISVSEWRIMTTGCNSAVVPGRSLHGPSKLYLNPGQKGGPLRLLPECGGVGSYEPRAKHPASGRRASSRDFHRRP